MFQINLERKINKLGNNNAPVYQGHGVKSNLHTKNNLVVTEFSNMAYVSGKDADKDQCC